MHDRVGVDLGNTLLNPVFEIGQGLDPDVTKKGPAHLGEQGLDQVEPRAVFGCMHILEPVGPGGEIGSSFLGDMGRMVVQDDPDLGFGRVVGIQILEQGDEFLAPMPFLHPGNDMAVMKVQCGQDGQRSHADIFVVPGERGMVSRDGRQIGRDKPQSLDARLLVHAHGIDRTRPGRLCVDDNLPVDHENFPHFAVEFGVFAFEVVGHLVGGKFLLRKNAVDGGLGRFRESGMSGLFGMGSDIGGQSASRPGFRRQSQVDRLCTGEGHDPSLGLRSDDRILGTVVDP